jgi:DNA-binding MarR family transcriptional regulator
MTEDIQVHRQNKVCNENTTSSKFYPKSLTLLVSILEMIRDGFIAAEIAITLNQSKSLISYYIHKAEKFGYVKESIRDSFKVIELTQAGKNFLAQYENQDALHKPICRLENVRFKAPVIKMPAIPTDWEKVQMNNWIQYGSEVDNIRVHLNIGTKPSIEFIPSPVDGEDPYKLHAMVLYDCTQVAKKLEEALGMQIGRLELSSKTEFVYYDPIAKAFCKHNGQLTVDSIGKINASKPRSIGEFEFHDPKALAAYMAMPARLYNIENQMDSLKQDIAGIKQSVREVHDLFKGKRYDKSNSAKDRGQ